MKKTNFYTLIYTPDNQTKSVRVNVNGYMIDGETGVYKREIYWMLVDLATGLALGMGYLTRKEAVEAYKKMDLAKVRKKEVYIKAITRFQNSPIVADD